MNAEEGEVLRDTLPTAASPRRTSLTLLLGLAAAASAMSGVLYFERDVPLML